MTNANKTILPELLRSLDGLTNELPTALISHYTQAAEKESDDKLVDLLAGALLTIATEKPPFDLAKARNILWTLSIANTLAAEITRRGLDQ